MLVSAAILAGVVVPFPSFAEYFGHVSRIPAVDGHGIKQTPKKFVRITPRRCHRIPRQRAPAISATILGIDASMLLSGGPAAAR